MILIIEVKNHQYFIEKKDMILIVEHLDLDVSKEAVYSDVKVLYYKDESGKVFIGTPYVVNAKVTAKVMENIREKTIRVRRYRPKSGIRKMKGHRQRKTLLKIESISVG